MRFEVRAMAFTIGIMWAIMFVAVAATQQVMPNYGIAFLEVMDGLYPGYAPGGPGSVLVGTLYAFVDGAIGGAVFAWLYNRFHRADVGVRI
jgi:hypothetical protein